MAQTKNSPPRNADDKIPALRIMRAYVAAKPDWLPEAPQAAQIQATADGLQTGQEQITEMEAHLSAARTAQQEKMAIGSGQFCGVRDKIYRKYGKDSDELINAGLQKLDLAPSDVSEPPKAPVIKEMTEVTPTSVKIRIETVPGARDYLTACKITILNPCKTSGQCLF